VIYARAVAAGVRWWLLVSAGGCWCPLLVAGVRCWWLVSAAGGWCPLLVAFLTM